MTAFDLEDDDFFAATFNSISDSDLMNVPSSTLQNISHDSENPFQDEEIDTFFSTLSEEISNFNVAKKSDSKILLDKLNTTESTRSEFTPKAKKRKFPGPAGIFTQELKTEKTICSAFDDCNQITVETTQSLSNSQSFIEDLIHPSWTKLRSVLSSTSDSLLSVAKYHNIAKVLLETSKRKLPKHLVVPLLCVLVKKFNSDEPHSIFVDDSGEVIGKIDKEVLDEFKDSLQDGISLVLEKVTFLCNVLILRKQNIVSIYFDDGTVKHLKDISLSPTLDDLSSMTSFQSPSTPKGLAAKPKHASAGLASGSSADFSKIARDPSSPSNFTPISANRNAFESSKRTATPKMNSNIVRASSSSSNSTPISASRNSIGGFRGPASPSMNFVANKALSSQNAGTPDGLKSRILQCNTTPNSIVPSSSGLQRVPNKLKTLPFLAKNSQSSVLQVDKSALHSNVQKEISPVKKVQVNDVEGDFEKDDFDELLLNLDESSFMNV